MRKLLNKRFVAMLLTLAMVLSLVPMVTFAADGDSAAADDGLVLNKSVTVNDDGTYTINLEAYATGTVTTSTVSVPTDIVLVLDVSGSMDQCITCGESDSKTHTSYVYTPVYELDTSETYYRDQNGNRAYYCSTCGAWRTSQCTSILSYHIAGGNVLTPKTSADSTGTQFYTRASTTGNCVKRIDALEDAAQLFVDETAKKNAGLTETSDMHRIAIVKFADDSYNDTVGNDFNSDRYNYTQVVKNLTAVTPDTESEKKAQTDLKNAIEDLSPAGATAADYGLTLAKKVLDGRTSTEKEERQAIVILFTDGEPNHSNGFSDSVALSAINKAKEIKDAGATVFSISVLAGSDPADITVDMNKYMNAVSSNYPAATANSFDNLDLSKITGGNNGYYKVASDADQLTSIFQEISNSVGSPSVTLTSEAVLKDIVSSSFKLPEDFTITDNIKLQTADYLGNGKFDDPVTATGVTATVNGNTVDVTGFDYSANYVVDAEGSVPTSGKKLIVTISGIEINESSFTAGQIETNDAASGIYSDGNQNQAVEYFDTPNVTLASKSYVVDYAKPFEVPVSDWGVDTVEHVGASASKITKIATSVDLPYGKVEKTEKGYTYTPQTMAWSGADVFYAFGTKTTNDVTNKIWSKVQVIPANNVYYEDSFAAIDYEGGDWRIVYSDDAEYGTNTEVVEGVEDTIHGWIESMKDDPLYSDGSAHELKTGAKASFTFSGTGVDIYSRTNSTTGIVTALLYEGEGENAIFSKYIICDNLAKSGDYYQIPTLSFTGLDATKTYKVELYVNNAKVLDDNGEPVKNDDGSYEYRSIYYLDGIRVYNPLGATTDAYTGSNQTTDFKEVRDMMGTGNVFIDLDGKGNLGDKTAYEAGEYGTYGPKNEVYLATGQSITFKVSDTTAAYYVGLKAPEGKGTFATISNGDNNSIAGINHSTDLYYKVVPADGYITISNNGTALLSVTKLQMVTPAPDATEIQLVGQTAEQASAEIAAFSLRSTVPYTNAVETEEEVEPVTPPEVDIDNPEPGENEDQPDPSEYLRDLLKRIIKGLRGWFGR